MTKVTCDLSISLDGYSAGHGQTEDRPFGDDGGDGWGSKLHAWFEDPAEQKIQMDRLAETKAFIMAATCSARSAANGTVSGTAGGATTRRTTPRSSC
ncbi:hypothetical protein [Lentzea indica]|uniref:hypothetical protein n=1 Tax=Lentzea indica TaxID=2604800 RepID=UPI001FE85652|nr:hypothetical protein [Lentzea indica]